MIGHTGNPLFKPPSKQFKDIYKLLEMSSGYSVAASWMGIKFVRYKENFRRYLGICSREFYGLDKINSPDIIL